MATEKNLADIGKALNELSWQWLNDNCPGVAEALTIAVERGATPGEVRRFVMARTERRSWL